MQLVSGGSRIQAKTSILCPAFLGVENSNMKSLCSVESQVIPTSGRQSSHPQGHRSPKVKHRLLVMQLLSNFSQLCAQKVIAASASPVC